MSNTIIMNQLFSGQYLDEGTNIGHEVINLFKAGNGNNYLYITSTGRVVHPEKVEGVIFVRNYCERGKVVEVIAGAPKVSKFEDNISDITYSNVPLSDLFIDNIYRGEKEKDSNEPVITFKADEGILVPKQRILLKTEDAVFSDDECPENARVFSIETNKSAINRKMRTYIDSESEKEAYESLRELLNDRDLWEKHNESFSMPSDESQNLSFLEVIKKEDDELVYSNLLKYFLEKDKKAFVEFSYKVLDLPNIKENYVIEREKSFTVECKLNEKTRKSTKYIDLWIEDDESIIVIENKIKSGVNGIENGSSQLKDYYDFASEKANEEGKTAYFYVFAPEYNGIKLNQYNGGDEYELITYNDLYIFFSEKEDAFKDDPFFGSFLKGLERHTKTMAQRNQDIMNARFAEIIRNTKGSAKV